MIVSGLAFGIDAIAHRSALQHQLPTIGVLGHGMDTIYPYHHRSLAKEMTNHGGLLTEFCKDTKPDKHNFPKRNRIVAGMADATIVIETALKGGSMITAELAYNYNRDLFAIPGRIHDPKSMGCMELIRMNKATILTSAAQLLEILGWREMKQVRKQQKELFIELSTEESVIVDMLKESETMPVDLLYIKSGLSSSAIAAAILNLELQNVIQALPGKMYRLI
jgi:DNA processing protein